MNGWAHHLIIAPIVVPLLAGTAMVLLGERRRNLKRVIGTVSAVLLVGIAITLLLHVEAASGSGSAVSVYRLGNWPATFGIVLVLDRMSALMLGLTSVLGLSALVFSLGRWERAGAHFHPLVQFQLMGLNGAFLTGDLFNLFVFFEVMLAASYGLALHGSGPARVRAGLHYIAVNLTASLLFLIGVSMIYGVAGTLNMADLASRIRTIESADRGLLEVGAAILGVAFLIKAAMWPMGFWLQSTYAAASPPASAILSILSKVGIYAVVRLWLLLFGESAGDSAGFGASWLLFGGLLTIAFGSVAVLATQNLARLAGASILVSSGTILAAVGAGQVAVTGGALFYLATSVLAIAAFFLLIELVERGRQIGADMLLVTREAYGEGDEGPAEEEEIAIPIPAVTAILGGSFLACTLLLAGLPPLSGFLAKFAILAPLVGAGGGNLSVTAWILLAALVVSGLATVVAMARAGIDAFWTSPVEEQRVHLTEIAPIAVLLAICVAMTIRAEPVARYVSVTAQALHAPQEYIRAVFPPAEPPPAKEAE